jgi:hypothetical protein
MSASQILLAGHGPEDRWLTESPNRTYFEAKYTTPRVNRTRKTYEIPFDNQGTTFGTTGICTAPVKGDYLTRLTLRAVFPPIYTIVPGQYVYPTPSSQVNGFIYVDMGLTLAVADGVTLSANTTGSHYFSVGAGVTLSGTGTLDGTFTIASIPTANSFTCLTTLTGTSATGTASVVGITPSDVVGYFSTSNFNLWVNNLTNKTWSVTNAVFNMTQLTVTTSDPSGFSVGQDVNLIIVSLGINGIYTIIAATDTTFTVVSTSGVYTFDPNDIVNPVVPPLSIIPTPTQFQFSSTIYTSISFGTADDAAFWGFDFRSGATYSFPVSTSWTYTQGGWIPGFLPPSLSTWYDSVAHKLCKAVRVLIGKQTINEYTGEYIEIQNDLTVSYENKAVLKLMNGTLDQTQATVAREYYTTLPIGTKEIPLYALPNQSVSVEIDFESFTNLSQNLNPGTGNFTDSASYLTYNGILNGGILNVYKTLSYQQYIFLLTYDGKLIVYDTTQPIDDTASYVVITAFVGSTGLFRQFCILGGVLYIQLLNGYIVKGYVNELIQGNTSSFISNNYLPSDTGDLGPPTGTLIADARYLYYAQSNAAQSNVYLVRYDTQSSFQLLPAYGYTSFDFTSNIDSSVSTVFQMISTGSQLIALTDTIGKFYVYNLNGNFTTSWNFVDYSSLLIDYITEGVLIGSTLYFVGDYVNLIQYSGGIFSIVYTGATVIKNLHAVGSKIYASNDTFQVFQFDTLSNIGTPLSYTLTDNTAAKIFANGPRFIYMFTQDPSQTTTSTDVVRFDPYPTNPTLQASILIDYESSPPGVPKPDKVLIGLVQTQRVTDMNYMNIRGPVKELWVTGASSTTNVFQYSDLSPQSTLAFTDGAQIVTEDVGTRTFLNTIQAFETHTTMPIRNVSVVPFEFDPESEIPNGTVNFSRIRDQVLSANAATVWVRTYNILAIQGGIGGLIFNS